MLIYDSPKRFFSTPKVSSDKKDFQQELNIEVQEKKEEKREVSETEAISKRFGEAIELMNKGYNSKLTIARLAQMMKLDKVSELENICLGKKEASFNFIKAFCERFVVNQEWLTYAEGYPFFDRTIHHSSPLSYYSDITELEPQEILFFRTNTDFSEVFIILQLSDFKFVLCSKKWSLSRHLDNIEREQLYDLYKLIKKLKGYETYKNRFGSRCIDQTEFHDLHLGKIFPRKYFV